LGCTLTGTVEFWQRKRTASFISAGPVAQFRPSTSGWKLSSTARAAPISEPSSMVPVASSVIWTWRAPCGRSRDFAFARIADRVLAGGESDLGLQQILAGLDQQHVHAALDQRLGLLAVGRGHGVVADVAQRGQLGRRPHGAGHKARLLRGRVLVGHLARQPRRGKFSSRVRSCRSYSASTMRDEPKLSVSITSQPASRNEA
jgi:hypothetical protein